MKSFEFMRDIFRRFPLMFLASTLLLTLLNLIEAAAIFTIVPIVDLFTKPDLKGISFITQKAIDFMHYLKLPVSLISFLAIFVLFNILVSVLQILFRHFTLKAKYSVLRELMLGTFNDFFHAKWYFFSSNKQGTLLNTFLNEMTMIGDAFGAIVNFFANILHLVLYLIVPFCLSWQVATVSLVTALIFAAPFCLIGRVNYRLGQLNTSTANEISSVIHESFGTAKLILGFGNQRASANMLAKAWDTHTKTTIKSQTLGFAVPIIYYPLGLLVVIISLLAATKLSVSFSETAALLYSFLRIIPAVGYIPSLKNSMDCYFPSYEQLINLRRDAKSMQQISGTRIFKAFNKEMLIKNLSFSYPGQKPILSDIDVRIPKGNMVAFVGKSGAGKTTLIDMIMGFHEPLTGQILVDGIPLQEFDINSYRKRVGYVPQDSVLFNVTIRENLLWADDSAAEEDIKRACRQANAEEFIEELPERYDTLVGDRGVRLSGGQIQRVALARALLRKPEILILDEATSSLDSHSERLIQQAIEAVAQETTVIVIAHRLSTILRADYMYVIKKGYIVEEGQYSDLMRNNGEFSNMLKLQAVELI